MPKELEIRYSSESICSDGSNIDTGEDEEFYETIEAPKFVDFTTPDHHRPDDRYWFCLRFGCEQKHEEEMDSEKIYKDFVLRVMAARSPNVRLQKCRNASRNMKCPMSVPSKYSKRRLSRIAVVSSISRKLGYEKEKAKPPSNPISTPKAKTKQVAAKYLTTPRSKKCNQDSSSFRSVQNPKHTTVAVPKNRMVAKALTFHSPKKAISLKRSVELRTPLKKVCEGMKRLEVTSQKKRLLGHSNGSIKNAGQDSSTIKNKTFSRKDNSVAKKVKPVKDKKECNLIEIAENDADSNKQQLTAAIECSGTVSAPIEANTLESSDALKQMDAKMNDPPSCLDLPEAKGDSISEGSEEGNKENSEAVENVKNHSTDHLQLSKVQNHETESTESDDKENVVSADENSISEGRKQDNKENSEAVENVKNHSTDQQLSEVQYHETESTESDDKENAVSADENVKNNSTDQQLSEAQYHETESSESDDKENAVSADENRTFSENNMQTKVLGEQTNTVKKIAQPVVKNHKGQVTTPVSAPPPGMMKFKKPKPTNPKPFRLRTDERSIHKESNFERKGNHYPDSLSGKSNVESLEQDKESADTNSSSSIKGSRTAQRTNTLRGQARSKAATVTPKKPNASSTFQVQKPTPSPLERSKRSFRKVESPSERKQAVNQRLASTKNPGQKLAAIVENTSKVAKTIKAREGKRQLTVPKEPRFHTTHLPRSCTLKLK